MMNKKNYLLSFIILLSTLTHLQSQTNYCVSKGNLPWEFWIGNVQLGSINNTSSKEGYGNFISQTSNVAQGTSIPLSILPTYSWSGDPQIATMQWAAWIDWNKNGTFEATEKVGSGNNATRSVSVAVPATALVGNTRLRVSMKIGGAPMACEAFEKGEVEDYTLNVTGGTVGGTTDNKKLLVTNVVGNNRVQPNGQLSVSVTIKNNASVASKADSVYMASWVANTGLGAGFFYSQTYSRNKVAIPTIAANQSVTIPAVFTMPATLSSNIFVKPSGLDFLLEPYFITKEIAEINNFGPPITGDSARKISYNFPILPATTTDLALSGSQINAIWDSANPAINVRLRIVNNGTSAVKNVFVEIHRANTSNSSIVYPNIGDFALTSGTGTVDSRDLATSFRTGLNIWAWKIPELAAGASLEATFSGTVRTEFAAPQTVGLYYKDLSINPKIIYADAVDNVKTNDSIPSGFTYRFKSSRGPLPDLTLANLNVPTPSVSQGQILNFKFDLKNQGTAAATGNFSVKSYLSNDQFLDFFDYQDGEIPTGNFAVGFTSSQIAGAMTVRNTVAAGQYYLILQVDSNNQISEGNEGNNEIISTTLITVKANTVLPDLRITLLGPLGIDLLSPVKTGDFFGVNSKVENGNVPTPGPLNTNFYFSLDTLLDARDSLVGIFTSGTDETFGGGVRVPLLPDGDYFIIAKVNADNAIPESNFNNNISVLKTPKVKIRNPSIRSGDVSLSISASKPTYVKYETMRFKVTAQNVGNQPLTNVKIELKRPALTANGGSKVVSLGVFNDYCPGGIECSEWNIPTLAAGATATLDAPFFILDATAPIVVNTKLLGSTPTDANTANNTATVSVSPAGAAGAAAPILGLRRQIPTQYIPLIVQSISPNPTEGDVVVEVESLTAQEVQFEFSNAMGQTIQSEKRAVEKGTNKVHFDVYEFTQGIYFIQTNVGKGRNAPTKFVKF
jgi:GEVED domain/CARDB/Domain of unknown function DUF11/Secretion system C-terminal sorting domain